MFGEINPLSNDELELKLELDKKYDNQELNEQETRVYVELVTRDNICARVFNDLIEKPNKTPEENMAFAKCYGYLVNSKQMKAQRLDTEELASYVSNMSKNPNLNPLGAVVLYTYSEELKSRTNELGRSK